MARVINGRLSGKLGNSVYLIDRYNRELVRAYAKPTVTRSPAQMTQRLKFKLIAEFINPLRTVIERYWIERYNKKLDSFSLAMSAALRQPILGVYPDLKIDFPAMEFTKGNLFNSYSCSLKITGNEGCLSWSDDLFVFDNRYKDDAVMLLIYNENVQAWLFFEDGAKRVDETFSFKLPESFVGCTLHGYMFFRDYSGKQASRTVYLSPVYGGEEGGRHED